MIEECTQKSTAPLQPRAFKPNQTLIAHICNQLFLIWVTRVIFGINQKPLFEVVNGCMNNECRM